MKHKIVGNLLIFVGVLLVLSAAALVGYNLWDNARADQSAREVLTQFSPPAQETDSSFSDDALSIAAPDAETIPPHLLNTDLEMPEILIDDVAYIGVLEIPDLQLTLPIASQWDPATARTAPCRYSGSVYSGNMVVAGHNYQKHFGKLPSLPIGSRICFTDAAGNSFLYEILECETVQATDFDGMCIGDWDLTLFTCTVGGHARFAIRCAALMENP